MERARGSKRLRGWRLEMTIEDPCQKGGDMELGGDATEDFLRSRLVSATQASEICHLARF